MAANQLGREIGRASARASKAARFRAELCSSELAFLMEAHDGISAKIVEEAGFKGIWASGLTMSAALGVRDNNEASWTQVLEILEFMSDASSIPILVDGDTGYGNFNNVRRLVKKLCQRDIAALAIEDKLFPKTNSFVGENQPLARIDEFCGKIKAGKDSQLDDNFCLIARTEALISGWGLNEALKRAEAYHAAGADGILVHSKRTTPDEITAFAQRWGDRCPLVIVPTMYYATPTEEFRKAGIAMVIWANHNLRAAITAMRETSRRVYEEASLTGVEGRIASVHEVFELSDNRELIEAEKRYLGPDRKSVRAFVLAATRGEELGPLTKSRPKCMIDIRGTPLLHRLVTTMRESGVSDITVVRGYRKDAISLPNIATIDNDAFEETGEAASLACAIDKLDGPCLVSYGDILYRRYILDNLLDMAGDIVVVVDALWRERGPSSSTVDLVDCSRPFTSGYLDEEESVSLRGIGRGLGEGEVDGEWIGLVKLNGQGAQAVRAELEAMRANGTLARAGLPELFARLLAKGTRIEVMYIAGHWLDVDDAFDLAKARNFL
ncbi:MAG: phosphoenolpyruvate mutase [Alphaproteobacteria bacterium]